MSLAAICSAMGERPVHIRQLRSFEKGVEILVATPRRLTDMIERPKISLGTGGCTTLELGGKDVEGNCGVGKRWIGLVVGGTYGKVGLPGKKVGRTTELRKPDEVIMQLGSREIIATPIKYETLLLNRYAKV
ncbi:hypothetical protein Tco_1314184 [Tanacetum coccineum]